MTKAGKENLEKELIYLKDKKQKELKEQVKEHRGSCDFSDNVSFSQTLEQQAIVKDRIASIQEMLQSSAIIDSKEKQTTIELGSTVTFMELPDGPKETYTIVGTIEADPLENKISIESPVGRSLLGSEKEEVISIEIPSGKIQVQVLAIK